MHEKEKKADFSRRMKLFRHPENPLSADFHDDAIKNDIRGGIIFSLSLFLLIYIFYIKKEINNGTP